MLQSVSRRSQSRVSTVTNSRTNSHLPSRYDQQWEVQSDVLLAHHTTIGLGGRARQFAVCSTVDHIKQGVALAAKEHLRLQILGGGSNVIFPDSGFDGLILRVDLRGVSFEGDGGFTHVSAMAGENWDDFVKACIEHGLGGIECLSGIPGLIGATPMQNVGAYGQEVRDTITAVRALDRRSLREIEFTGTECEFGYRQSRFKSYDAGKFIITRVAFRLQNNGTPRIRYPELQKYVESTTDPSKLEAGRPALEAVRAAVLALRKRKSMVVDPTDPDSKSVGSFFMNPVLKEAEFQALVERWMLSGNNGEIPTFSAPGGIKVPAAWLVENSGFHKGYRKGGVRISTNHTLALVNCGGTARELLELSREIQDGVYEMFNVHLEQEPVVVT